MQKSELKKYNLPDTPGVYLFKQGRKVLYIGKATSLRDRVRSYFDDDLIATRGPRIVDMVTKADRVAHESTPTVLEALVREAALIKKYQPIANTDGKDDSSFMYAVITNEKIPRVLAVRGKDVKEIKASNVYGPFPSGAQLKEGLRLIRRIFPFFDTPRPVGDTSKHQKTRIEFNKQIGQYPREFTEVEYRKTIRLVRLFLAGRGKELRKQLKKEMLSAAREERFENAARARRELFALDHIQDVSLIRAETRYYQDRYPLNTAIARNSGQRVEGYDTAHLSGTNAIGVMTVVVDGSSVKSEYRTFRIHGNVLDVRRPTSDVERRTSRHERATRKLNNDIASLKEILSRRLGHSEWRFPKVIVVDGGKTQKNAAESVLKELGVKIPVVAVVKDERHRPREIIGARLAGISEADAVLANAEAHRFSLARHRYARLHSQRQK